MSRKVRSMVALLMLMLFLGTGAAHALPSQGQGPDRSPGMFAALWDWVESFVGADVPFFGMREASKSVPPPAPLAGNGEGGGYIDPNG